MENEKKLDNDDEKNNIIKYDFLPDAVYLSGGK